ncbi:MAG: VTT domain-containing protein [Proteobacteria bacterium]|nr:VTT domain-containing protein [Pseudomonadota bacterium]
MLNLLRPTLTKAYVYASVVILLCVLSGAWGLLLPGSLNTSALLASVRDLLQYPFWGGVFFVLLFVLSGFVSFPVVILIPATAFAAGPVSGACYSMLGILCSAMLVYGAGYALGRETVAQLDGRRMDRIARRLAHRGFVTVVTARLLPVAPFTLVSLVAGSFNIRFSHYVLGTCIGMLPAVVIMSAVGDNLNLIAESKMALGILICAATVAMLLLAGDFFRKRLSEKQ